MQTRKCRLLTVAFICVFSLSGTSFAKEAIDYERLARAIYLAEGGAKTRHPYGILQKFKHTSPKQACLNTIRRRYSLWDGRGSFIEYLGKSYCPIGAKNDPTGLNRHWVKNVKAAYARLV